MQFTFANGSFDFCRSNRNLFFHLCFYFIRKNNFFVFFGIWFSVRGEISFLNGVFNLVLGGVNDTCRVIRWTKHYPGSIVLPGY